jgi:GNAT superfamily N-acetyltransferase
LTTEESKHVEILSNLMGFPEADIKEQLWLGHRAYLARLGTLPVAVGWSATGEAALLGGRVTLHVPANNRYLYGFVTHPDWRGRGIYPHLLQSILHTEGKEQERFWIIHLLENTASQRGIHKAGGSSPPWSPSHRGYRRHVADAIFLKVSSLLLITLTTASDRVITSSR